MASSRRQENHAATGARLRCRHSHPSGGLVRHVGGDRGNAPGRRFGFWTWPRRPSFATAAALCRSTRGIGLRLRASPKMEGHRRGTPPRRCSRTSPAPSTGTTGPTRDSPCTGPMSTRTAESRPKRSAPPQGAVRGAAPGDRVAALHRRPGARRRELCARPSRRFDRWRRLAEDSRLPIPGRAPWSGFGRWSGGGVPLNPGHRMARQRYLIAAKL
jgi:hypothetical protein